MSKQGHLRVSLELLSWSSVQANHLILLNNYLETEIKVKLIIFWCALFIYNYTSD